jgi:poly(rC)-binding protein 2/3/4
MADDAEPAAAPPAAADAAPASPSSSSADEDQQQSACEEKLRAVTVSLKRPAPEAGDDEAEAEEGGAKRPAPSATAGAAAAGGAGDAGDAALTFRLLVPARRAGPLIGRGGACMKRMRDATGARIRVLEPVLGCEERVVELCSAGAVDGEAPPAQARPLRAVHAILVQP